MGELLERKKYIIELEINKSTSKVLFHPDRLTFKFAEELKSDIQYKYETFDDFTKNYYLNNKKKTIFFRWLEKQEIEFKEEELEEHWGDIQNRILSNVASSIWGKEYMFKQLLKTDKQAQDALDHFIKARELIRSFNSSVPASE